MFFSSTKKATESSPSDNDFGQHAASSSKQQAGGSAAPSCVFGILLFNPLLLPDGAAPREEKGSDLASESGSSEHEKEEDNADGLSREEREQESKIIYSYPPNREPEERRSQAGLLEGLLMFAKPFSPLGLPVQSICTEKYIIVMEEVEKDFWLSMTFAANAVSSLAIPEKASHRADEDTEEAILLGVLRGFYALFRLLHGRFGAFLERDRRHELLDVLNDYAPSFVETLDGSRLSLFNAVAGFHFAPVDRLPYLAVPSLISLLKHNYPCILHAALLLNGCLVYHSMNTPVDDGCLMGSSEIRHQAAGLSFEPEALLVLYNYLVCTEGNASVDPHKLLKPPYARVPTAAARPGGGCSSFGRSVREEGNPCFLFGPVGQFAFLPTVHLGDNSTGCLLALLYEQLLLILVLDETDQRISDVTFLQSLRTAAVEGPCGLRELNGILSSEFKKVMKQEDTYRFIYFNQANRAIRISNKSCPQNSNSPPFFKNFCFSAQELQRVGHMHCKFLGFSASPPMLNGCKGSRRASDGAISPSSSNCSKKAETHKEEDSTAAEKGGWATGVRAGGKSLMEVKLQQQEMGILDSVRTMAVKDSQSGWLIGRRTCDREYFLALDDAKTTFTKAMEDVQRFSALHFSNIFV
ncbi:hypothetical protein cyc_00465 [Cyclospora cayetanensis]|uniref:CCZ1/INTU/HSP4 first Longin domain-containing protein n=1 Tax=Cyclospora cayetanensis TaxID=88456 RepID=A0A1D3CUT4_9EIME|nr:hypothetical protein cyc_00465 [Cyclospora cayetanensis]